MLRFQTKRRKRTVRRGIAGIWGVVCLILATAVAATLGRLALTEARLVAQEQRRSQCDWLLHAGWTLANSRIHTDPKYTGETWKIPAEELGGSEPGEVVIEIKDADPEIATSKRQVKIIARFPKDSPRQVQLSAVHDWESSRDVHK
jgi:type II secretory pathway component PulK